MILSIAERLSTPLTVSLSSSQPDLSLLELTKFLAGVRKLTQLRADLSKIPTHLLPTKKGADGHVYYKIEYDIQVTYYSAYTKYELFYNGINYGSVSAEYV